MLFLDFQPYIRSCSFRLSANFERNQRNNDDDGDGDDDVDNNNNNNNYFKKKMLKEEIESKCRLCKQHEETIDHNLGMPHFGKERIFNETR